MRQPVSDLFLRDRRQIHREQDAGLRQFIHADDRASRSMIAQLLDVGLIHAFEILHILEEDVDVNDMLQIRSDGFKHDFEGFKNLFGL
jgi:hypothetical protein